MNVDELSMLARLPATELELRIAIRVMALNGASCSVKDLISSFKGKKEHRDSALARLVDAAESRRRGWGIGWKKDVNWFVQFIDPKVDVSPAQLECFSSAAAYMAQHDCGDFMTMDFSGGGRADGQAQPEIREQSPGAVGEADGCATAPGLAGAGLKSDPKMPSSPTSSRGGKFASHGGEPISSHGRDTETSIKPLPPTGGNTHVRHDHVGSKIHGHEVHVDSPHGRKSGTSAKLLDVPFEWAPNVLHDVGDIEPVAAGDIFRAIQKASCGRIDPKYLDAWKRRIFEAPHVAWGLAQQLISGEQHSDTPEKFLNFHYRRIVCDLKPLAREKRAAQ